ncbi:MAG: manganese efflux pump, partial [Spirochaetales bacterium]|nr:manganese efflux pump [Spirochaetales bacterium]
VESFGVKEDPACDDEEIRRHDIRKLRTVLLLAVATSIDALAVGASYALVGSPICVPALVIGCVTFALSFAGIEFGKRLGARFERGAEIAGGLVLVGLGARILFEHLFA